MSSMKQFKTDPELETGGIEVDYGDFAVRIARAGGANKNYTRILEKKTAPYRRAIESGVLPRERMEAVLMEVFAEGVVLNWYVGEGEARKVGIELPDGSIVEPTAANILTVFKDTPDLFWDLHEQAGKIAVFRRAAVEEESKN